MSTFPVFASGGGFGSRSSFGEPANYMLTRRGRPNICGTCPDGSGAAQRRPMTSHKAMAITLATSGSTIDDISRTTTNGQPRIAIS